MSIRATTLWRHFLVALTVGLICAPAMAQVATDPVLFASKDAITTSFVKTQNFGGTDQSTEAQWLKVEFHYSVTPAVGDYLDEVEFKVWVEGRDLLDPTGKPGEGIAVTLVGSVTYVNVYKGKDVYGVVYLNPSSLGRYNAGGGVSDFDRKFNVHVEADIGGKYVDSIDKNKEDDKAWYQAPRAVPGLLYLQNQSPFITTDPDRYPALKLPKAS
jgi:hypothetical protein